MAHAMRAVPRTPPTHVVHRRHSAFPARPWKGLGAVTVPPRPISPRASCVGAELARSCTSSCPRCSAVPRPDARRPRGEVGWHRLSSSTTSSNCPPPGARPARTADAIPPREQRSSIRWTPPAKVDVSGLRWVSPGLVPDRSQRLLRATQPDEEYLTRFLGKRKRFICNRHLPNTRSKHLPPPGKTETPQALHPKRHACYQYG